MDFPVSNNKWISLQRVGSGGKGSRWTQCLITKVLENQTKILLQILLTWRGLCCVGSTIRNVLSYEVYNPGILELICCTFCRWRFTFYLYIFTYGVRFLKKVGTCIIMLSLLIMDLFQVLYRYNVEHRHKTYIHQEQN